MFQFFFFFWVENVVLQKEVKKKKKKEEEQEEGSKPYFLFCSFSLEAFRDKPTLCPFYPHKLIIRSHI